MPETEFEDLASKEIPTVEDPLNEFKEFYQYDKNMERLGNLPNNERRAAIESIKASSRERMATAVCAMGNKEGGFVYVGVQDDGTPTGLQKDLDLNGFANYSDVKKSLQYLVSKSNDLIGGCFLVCM